MGRITSLAPALLLLVAAVATTMAERENTSSSGSLFWTTAKEENDLSQKSDDSTSEAEAIVDDLDGGFSSLDSMLQWAIGHSDPAELKQTAEGVQRLSPAELQQRRREIKELMDKMKMPSDARMMQTALDDLKNMFLSLQDRLRALQELVILVEPIDNANDLCKLGGLSVIVQELDHPDSEIRTTSAWLLGKASQNNPFVQKQVLDLGVMAKLMKMVKSSSSEEATKAFYAVSALISNNLAGQALFYAEAGDTMLQEILSNSNIDIRLLKKAVFLIGDLAEFQLENADQGEMSFFSNRFFLKSVVDLTASADLDLQEKALLAIKNLLKLKTTEVLVFKDFCGLDGALERMKERLEDLALEDFRKDYVIDIEGLRWEVEQIFIRKLQKVPVI